jgi:hypothetical protein
MIARWGRPRDGKGIVAPLLDALAGPRPYSIAHVSAATHFLHDLVVAHLLTERAPFAAFTPKFLRAKNPSPVAPRWVFCVWAWLSEHRSPGVETALRHIW